MIHEATAGYPADAELHVDLGAIVANWRRVQAQASGAECAAVVKADGYGLGAGTVASALAAAGCRSFFVATLEEGAELRAVLPQPRILVLNGLRPDSAAAYDAHALQPVLNTEKQVRAWAAHGRNRPQPAPAAIQLDTGMTRLGLPPDHYLGLFDDGTLPAAFPVSLVMSHLACSDDPENPQNARQRAVFDRLRARHPAVPHSLAASSGVLLGADFHYDLVRPGIALYGGNPIAGRDNPYQPVVTLCARILQVHEITRPGAVGYGATFPTTVGSRIATLGTGYADGYFRHLGDRSSVYRDGRPLPVVGRVSMDMLAVDIGSLSPDELGEGDWLELLNEHCTIDDLAAAGGTIAHEVLTQIGRRYRRTY